MCTHSNTHFYYYSLPSHIQHTDDQGQILFISSSGEMTSDPSLTFDKTNLAVKMDKFSAHTFYGDSINFRGREIRNAHLVDSSIEGLKHLSLDSLALPEQEHVGLAVITKDGMLQSTRQLQWDENTNELRLPSLSSFAKSGLEIRSDVDFTSHQLKNVNLEADTTLEHLIFRDGYIENTVLHNVTATDLNLGDVTLDSLSISQFESTSNIGSLLVVGDDGLIEASPYIKQQKKDGSLLIDTNLVLTKSLDLTNQDVYNANLRSGSIDGNIDVAVDHIKAKGISLTDIQDDKTITTDGLAVLGLDGKLKMGPITIDDSSGSLGNFKVHGTIDFEQQRGKIKDANIVGGTVDELKKLSVAGETELGMGLQVIGESYLDGSLTVSGSVLGSGPYVDVSDKRFKKNIERMDSVQVLDKICQLDGVSYELDLTRINGRLGSSINSDEDVQARQFGFIAQEVEEIFPELLSSIDTDSDYKGLQYSRFAPILIEGLKQLTEEVRTIQEWKLQMMKDQDIMSRKIHSLEQQLKLYEVGRRADIDLLDC